MNKIHLVKILSVSIIIIFTTNTIGFAAEGVFYKVDNVNCGKWEFNILKDNDRRINIEPIEKYTENICGGTFILNNNTGITIKGFHLNPGYSMELDTVSRDNANIKFYPYDDQLLIPGLDVDIESIPINYYGKANILIQGTVTLNSILFIDLPLYLFEAIIDLANVNDKCIISPPQLVLILNRTAPILENAGQLALANKFQEANDELSRVNDIYINKIIEATKDAGLDCLSGFLLNNLIGAKAKITAAFTLWAGTLFFDYLRFDGEPVQISLSYTPEIASLPVEKWIAFLNQNNIWLIHPDGSNLTQITQDNSDILRVLEFKWSPDGKTLAYSLETQSGKAIFLYDTQTSTTRMLLNDDVGGGFDWLPPNGKKVIYDTPIQGDNLSDFHNKGFWSINIENGNILPVLTPTRDFSVLTNPNLSSEGSMALFPISCFEPQCVTYGVADLNTQKIITLPAYGTSGCKWSPNDLLIACSRQVPDSEGSFDTIPHEIVIIDKNGNIIQKVTLEKSDFANYWFVWSPDGKNIAIGYLSGQKGQTLILSLETGELQHLTTGAPLAWTSDGNWILSWDAELLLSSDNPRHFYLINVVSGVSTKISEFDYDGLLVRWQP